MPVALAHRWSPSPLRPPLCAHRWCSSLSRPSLCAHRWSPLLVPVAIAAVEAAIITVVVTTARCFHRQLPLLALSPWLSPLPWMSLSLRLQLSPL
jgi:hypothetical protein